MIQGYLSEVGVDVSITEYDWTTYKTKVQTDPYDICFYGWTGEMCIRDRCRARPCPCRPA